MHGNRSLTTDTKSSINTKGTTNKKKYKCLEAIRYIDYEIVKHLNKVGDLEHLLEAYLIPVDEETR